VALGARRLAFLAFNAVLLAEAAGNWFIGEFKRRIRVGFLNPGTLCSTPHERLQLAAGIVGIAWRPTTA
jgi:hypothetical protein